MSASAPAPAPAPASGIALDFNREKDAGVDVMKIKAAKQAIRAGSKKHASYPSTHKPRSFSFWTGLDKILQEHKTLLRGSEGQTVILLGDPGTGKTASVKGIIHGDTGVKPERSLTIRFAQISTSTTADTKSEEAVLARIANLVGFPDEKILPASLADFVMEGVLKEEKKGIAAAQSILPVLESAGKYAANMLLCGSAENVDEDEEALAVKISALPADYKNKEQEPWPIILLDDVNSSLITDGPVAQFIYSLAQAANGHCVIVYIITNNRETAYKLWQINGGNWIRAHHAVKDDVEKEDTLEKWAKHETKLKMTMLSELQTHEIPSFIFKPKAFIFSIEARENLLYNMYSPQEKDENARNCLRADIGSIVYKFPDEMIDHLMLQLDRLGYGRNDGTK